MVAFFEFEAGVAFLHRLVVAAHFVITQTSPGGIRPVCLFLELSHLDRFVGASYGPHQKVSKAMEQAIIDGPVKSLLTLHQLICSHCGTRTYEADDHRFGLDFDFLRDRQ